ncbi:MAG: CHAT domain-containing protein [Actinoallomurus sp.]
MTVDPADAAAAGMRYAERYEQDGAEDDREAAIDRLCGACDVTVRPDGALAVESLTLAELLLDRAVERQDTSDLDAALGYARWCADGVADDDPRLAFPLYTLGVVHLTRTDFVAAEVRDDCRAAEIGLRRSAALLPSEHPLRLEAIVRLGIALATVVKADLESGEVAAEEVRAHAEEAVQVLTDGLDALPADHPLFAMALFHRGLAYSARKAGLQEDDDRQAALADFAAILEMPDLAMRLKDGAHAFSASLLLTGWELDLRSGSSEDHFARLGRMIARSGKPISEEAARAATDHLAAISDTARDDPNTAGLMRALNMVTRLGSASGAGDAAEVFDATQTLAASMLAEAENALEDQEARSVVELVRGFQALWQGESDGTDRTAESIRAFTAAANAVPESHFFRQFALSVLGGAQGIPLGGRASSRTENTVAIEALRHALEEMPDDGPERAPALSRLGSLLATFLRFDRDPAQLEQARELLEESAGQATDPTNVAVNEVLLAMLTAFQSPSREAEAAAMRRLDAAMSATPEGSDIRSVAMLVPIVLMSRRGVTGVDLEALDAALHYARHQVGARADTADLPEVTLLARYLLAIAPIMRNPTDAGPEKMARAIAEVESLTARLPEHDHLRDQMLQSLAMLGLTGELTAHPDGTRTAEAGRTAEYTETLVTMLGESDPDGVYYSGDLCVAGSAQVQQGLVEHDLRRVDEGLVKLAQACDLVGIQPLSRSHALAIHGMALRMRYALSRDRGDLLNAVARLEEARRCAALEEGDMDLATLLHTLGRVYHERNDRQLGDRRAAAETGVAAMRELARDVLLQSTERRALDIATSAAGDAAEVAQWCLHGGFNEAAIEALELGRGMVLHAATVDASIPVLLREAGHDDLAVSWELARSTDAPWDRGEGDLADPARMAGSSPDVGAVPPADLVSMGQRWSGLRLPGDLRRQVLEAIEGTAVERRLLAPLNVTEIAAALSEADVDALIYLLPWSGAGGGAAVVIDRGGETDPVRLPSLAVRPGGPLAAFVQARRDAGDGAAARMRGSLATLCDWAWGAAMATILAKYPTVRRPRLILVPVGELGIVPWHAARRQVADGEWRYACQDATISYAASARQFMEACRRERMPLNSAPALVRVRGSRLFYATQEIMGIHRRHYSEGRLLGATRKSRIPSLPATAQNVQELFPGQGDRGASLLHLGCHAEVAESPAESTLVTDGPPLSMADILRSARQRKADAPGGLVVLSACDSDTTGASHDEALTLASAFLTTGAVGAVGARWQVDDVPTASLMIMFHHYLNAGYDDPATALRAAQLWMLNPDRRMPVDVDPALAEDMRCYDLSEIDAWAAFTYQGR